MDLEQLMRETAATLESQDERLVAAYLFGSVARGEAGPGSDVDVAILLRSDPAGRLDDLRFAVEGDLEGSLGRRCQVVLLNQAPPDLVHRVLRDGRLLVDRDPSTRIAFEVRARNEYFDLLPVLQRYRRREAVRS